MINVPQYGARSFTRVVVNDTLEYTDDDAIKTISGLQSLVKGNGSYNIGSLSLNLADPAGEIHTRLQQNMFKKVDVTQEFYLDDALQSSHIAFRGVLNPPLIWSEKDQTTSVTANTKLEGQPIGFSLQAEDDPEELYEGLYGKAWPLAFGTVEQQPTIGFKTDEDGEYIVNSSGPNVRTGSATVASLAVGNLTRSDAETYVELIKDAKLAGLNTVKAGAFSRGGALRASTEDEDGYLLFNTRRRVLTTTPDGTAIDVEEKPSSNVNDFSEALNARIKLADYAATFYTKTGDSAKKTDLLKAVVAWCNSYLEYLGGTTAQKLAYNQAQNLNGSLRDPVSLAESYADAVSPYTDEVDDVIDSIDIEASLQNLHVTNNTLTSRTTGTYEINLNGARLSCLNNPNKLTIYNLLPACSGISFSAAEDGRVNAFKSTDKRDITGMYCKINDQVIYITGAEVTRDNNGDFQEVTYTFDNLFYKANVEPYTDINNNYTYFGHYITAKQLTNGTISEASVTILPSWDLPNNVGTQGAIKFLSERLAPVPSEGLYVELLPSNVVSHIALTEDTWQVQPGDTITPWTGCPSFDNETEPQEQSQSYYSPIKYICNLLPNSTVHEVFSRTDNAVIRLPDQWFQVNPNDEVAGQPCTTVLLTVPPSKRGIVDLTDDVFVTLTSPVSSSTADIMNHISTTYLELPTDLTGDLIKYPMNFTYFDQRDALKALEELAFQSRSALYQDDTGFKAVYLGKKPTLTALTDDDLIEATLVQDVTPDISRIRTSLTGLYKIRYTDLAVDGSEIQRELEVKNNSEAYGVFEEEYDYYAYNRVALVEKSLNFWLKRKSELYRKFTFEVTLGSLDLAPFQGVSFTLGEVDYEGVIELNEYNPDTDIVKIVVHTSQPITGDDPENYWSA